MKIHFDNVSINSNSGPNSFGKRLIKCFHDSGHEISLEDGRNCDVSLVFIEPSGRPLAKKIVHRLDGIWFSPEEFESKNSNIKFLYQRADHVIWQSEFDKQMTTKWWNYPRSGSVIRNGIELQLFEDKNLKSKIADLRSKYEKIFICSANWHPQKRLNQNIELFKSLKRFYKSSCLIVMGNNARVLEEDVFVTGSIPHEYCIQLFQSADWMIHLAWLDHCPNTVIEALSCNVPVICSEDGGTKELVQNYGVVLKEKIRYNFELTNYENPPVIDLSQITNLPDRKQLGNPPDVSIQKVAQSYIDVFLRLN